MVCNQRPPDFSFIPVQDRSRSGFVDYNFMLSEGDANGPGIT